MKKLSKDPRLYYLISLVIILIWVPIDYFENIRRPEFIGWEPFWNLVGDNTVKLNVTILAIEFVFITVIYILFRKKNKRK